MSNPACSKTAKTGKTGGGDENSRQFEERIESIRLLNKTKL